MQARAAARGVTVMPLSRLYLHPATAARPGLVLGFAAAPVEEIRPGVKRLPRAIEEVLEGGVDA